MAESDPWNVSTSPLTTRGVATGVLTAANVGTASGTADTPQQTTAIVAVAGLSMAGCLFVIASYLLWPDIRTRTRQLLVFLSLADFMNSAGNAAGAACAQWCGTGAMRTGTLNCQLQSFVTTYSSLCSFAWTVSIAVFLYWMFSSGDVEAGERRVPWLHVFSWGLPLAVTLAAQFGDALGNDDSLDSSGWCWIRRHPGTPHFGATAVEEALFEDRRARTFWLMMGGKAWEMLAYVVTSVLYVAIKCHVYSETHHGRRSLLTSSGLATAQRIDRRLMFVPIVFVLLRIWGTVRTLLDIADSGMHPESWFHNGTLRLMHGIGDNLPGFFNFIIFCCFSPKIRSKFFSRHRARGMMQSRPATPSDRTGLLTSDSFGATRSAHFNASDTFSTGTGGLAVADKKLKNPAVSSARSSPFSAGSLSSTGSVQ